MSLVNDDYEARSHKREMAFWRQIIIGVVIVISIMAACNIVSPGAWDNCGKIEKVTVQ